jgi:chemotaxis signal transduction protein
MNRAKTNGTAQVALPRAGELSALNTAQALLSARAARYAAVETEAATVQSTVVTFRRGRGRYALPLMDLREIRGLNAFCRLPGARAAAPGVVHYRGELLSLHDLWAFLSGETAEETPTWMLVAEHAGERMGLLGDEVLDVVELAAGSIQALPLTLGEAAECFSGMTDDGSLVLDVARSFRTPRLATGF